MSIVQIIQITGTVIGALLVIGGAIAVIYAAFKRSRTDDNRKADRELIDTLKTSNDLLRQEKKDTLDKLDQATNDISELRGEVRTLRDMPLQSIGTALLDLVRTGNVILKNQEVVFQHMGITGFNATDATNNSKEAKQP
jgi:hypothetical protein